MTTATAQTYEGLDPFVDPHAPVSGLGFLFSSLTTTSNLIPAWWSPQRDVFLRNYVKKSGHLSSAVNTMVTKIIGVPFEFRARNKNNRASVQRAQEVSKNLNLYSQRMQGLTEALRLFLLDYFTQDNGGFLVLLAPPNRESGSVMGPISPGDGVWGVRHLDSQLCTRTGNVEWPIVFRPTAGPHKGKPIPIHFTRVISLASMPSTDETRNGVGFCAVSRAFDAAQAIMDMVTYRREKMGSMPSRQILIFSGVDPAKHDEQMGKAKQRMAREGTSIFAKTIEMAFANADVKAHLIDLTRAGDGFDEKVSFTLAMYALALAFDTDARSFWSATETGATKGDAQVQHLKSYGRGIADVLAAIKNAFELYVLPSDIEMVHDYVDDQQDQMQAEVRHKRAQQRTIDLKSKVYSERVARVRAMDAGDLAADDFEQLELGDGRLVDGTSVLALYESQDPDYTALLNLGVDDPTNVEANDAKQMLANIHQLKRACTAQILTATRDKPNQIAKRCLAALETLSKMYQPTPLPTAAPAQVLTGKPPTDPDPAPDGDEAEEKSLGDYRRSLRALSRGYYKGDFDRFSYTDQMIQTIQRNFRQAWERGIKGCGLTMDDLKASEKAVLDKKITDQYPYILGLADAIDAAKADNENKIGVRAVFERIDLWVDRWDEVFYLAKITCCGDKNYKWRLDPAKQNCPDCAMLDGLIYRGSEWAEANLYPKSSKLACGGWRCGCKLEETDDPANSGKPPVLIGKSNQHLCTDPFCSHEYELAAN